jgi:hypothetical protein
MGPELGVDAVLNDSTNGFVNYSFQAEPDPNPALSELNLPPGTASTRVVARPRYFGASMSYVGKAFWQDVLDSALPRLDRLLTTFNASVGICSNGRYGRLKAVNLTNRQCCSTFADVRAAKSSAN